MQEMCFLFYVFWKYDGMSTENVEEWKTEI